MAWDVELSPAAFAFLSNMEKKDSERLTKKLEDAAKNPKHYLERLSGHDESRLRIGDYRAIILLLHDRDMFYVETIEHRKKAYKKKN